jgi:hypothetical protein
LYFIGGTALADHRGQNVLMSYRTRPGRTLFLGYLCAAWTAILMAAPLVFALEPSSAGAGRDLFREADADSDGYVSPAEAARLSGLSAAFARADANRDERLNRIEFRHALRLGRGY